MPNRFLVSAKSDSTDNHVRGTDFSKGIDPSKTESTEAPVAEHDIGSATLSGQDDSAAGSTSHKIDTNHTHADPPYSVFTKSQKRFIVFMASWAGFFSPVSATIYLPALNDLASDMNVSTALINLTITSYMIFQGLAPSFIGNLADAAGRRPAYTICFVIYIAANIGLALQHNYAALFVLRCLQSTGSSATIAMASAVVSDVATPAERGKYMGFTLAGSLLGPAFGPVVGGLLTQFLSWRAIFWFLTIFSGAFLSVFAIFYPETARTVVGNGSIPPSGINMSFMNYLAVRRARQETRFNTSSDHDTCDEATRVVKPRARFPNPLSSIKIIFDKSNALLLFYNAFLFAAFYDVTATIPSQFAAIYNYNDLQIGLCYIPFGAGSLVSTLVSGQVVDWNFRRWCHNSNIEIRKGRDQDLNNFPIERVRLQVALPALYVSTIFLLVFGWVLNFHGPIPVLLVVMFLFTFFTTIAFNVTSTLLVDFYPTRAATATAANNLVRCILGAAATGLIIPMIDGMGIGWSYTFLSLFLLTASPMLWLLSWKGMSWRKVRVAKVEEARRKKQSVGFRAIEAADSFDGTSIKSCSAARPSITELDTHGRKKSAGGKPGLEGVPTSTSMCLSSQPNETPQEKIR